MTKRAILVTLVVAACSSGNGEGLTTRECTDGEDNDDNGLVDCDDPGCEHYTVCDEAAGDDTGDTGEDTPAKAEVVVNEFQASNATTLTDEAGAYPDWIELHNYGDTDVDLTGYTITDDLEEPDKFVLGSLAIRAGDYLVLFADGDTEESALHVGFSLARAGESIGFYDTLGCALTELNYEEQGTDWSAARIPDASSNWEVTDSPTPGSANRPSE